MKKPTREVILGPTLRHIEALGLDGQRVDVATAFYSKRALESLKISAKEVRVYCRIDLKGIDEWCSGHIDPEALLKKIDALVAAGTKVSLFGHPEAHAKAYTGRDGALVGSANLTMRGFGGGLEIAVYTRGAAEVKLVRDELARYQSRLNETDIDDLREYVRKNLSAVKECRKKRPSIKDQLPNVPRDNISAAMGSYKSFLTWLGKQAGHGAKVILDRANGQGNLTGHIHRNFYGLRQFFLAYPEFQVKFSKQDPDLYKLSRDSATESFIADFVINNAADEADFKLSAWRTYLPEECGGRAGKHGGTIGNLNRMLPLVARYLENAVSKKV